MQTAGRITGFVGIIILGLLILSSFVRLHPRATLTHTPDDKHLHQVFGRHRITQQIVAPTDTLAGLELFVDENSLTPADAPLFLHVRLAGTDEDIRTVKQSIAKTQHGERLVFAFERIENTHDRAYEFELEAPSLNQSQALRIRYQTDASKYPLGRSWSSDEAKQGSLGFVVIEEPSALAIIARWIIDSDNFLVWPSIAAMIFGILGWHYQKNAARAETWWHDRWNHVPRKHLFFWFLGILTATFFLYWPALQQFYYHDDLALLARGIQFTSEHPWEIISARAYLETDPYSQFALPFWRPLSAGIYPLVTFFLFKLNSVAVFALHLLLTGITGGLLFLLALLYLQKPIVSGLTVTFWLAHSSKVGALYWWSSSQDILASLLILTSILLYSYWRSYPSKRVVLYGAISTAALAMLSKEHAILAPLIIWIFCEFPPLLQAWKKKYLVASFIRIAPFVFTAGIYLALRTIAFSDQTLPELFRNDTTYEMATSVSKIAQNFVTYGAWSAEQWIWPENIFNGLDGALGSWMWEIKIQKPLYPGIIALIALLLLPILFWKKTNIRTNLLLGTAWWLLFLGPTLFLNHQWDARWLYMPIFGVGFILGVLFLLLKPQLRNPLVILSIVALLGYGFWQARDEEHTKFSREQAAYSRVAFNQFKDQKHVLNADSKVVVVGVTPHQTTSVNAYLFRLAGMPANTPLIRTDRMPTEFSEHDIVIDMSDYDAFYPHYDQD
ncbi:MAG: hypothetical protein WD200_03880 [Candidatus Andersenbacteria bacterium]